MIRAKSIEAFCHFIHIAKALDTPFKVLCSKTDMPAYSTIIVDKTLHQNEEHKVSLVLCCNLFTVFFSTTLRMQDKDSFYHYLDGCELETFKDISIQNDVLCCK